MDLDEEDAHDLVWWAIVVVLGALVASLAAQW